MEPIRERIEEFLQRYWHEQNRVVRVLVVAVAILLALLLALRWLRVLRVLAVPVLVGAILVVGWLLFGPLLTIPRFTTEGPVVRNGVAVIVACGKKSGFERLGAAMKYAPEPRTGTWGYERRGNCTVWHHHPPDATQREARHERAVQSQASGDRNEFVWACGRKVLAEYWDLPEYQDLARDIAKGMRKDCGIYGHSRRGTAGNEALIH